jgi:hypothetical protein
MKNKIIYSAVTAVAALMLMSATIRPSSSGAPPSHTGAPGEQTCAAAGCHDDATVNEGSAIVSLELGNGERTYTPGKTYPVKVRISDPGVSRFGFQIVALENKTLKDRGSFTISDSVRTQQVTNQYALKDRKYITYTFNGTDAVKTGFGEWVINWTAPNDARNPITFYLAAVSGNDDMTDKGDKVFTMSSTLSHSKLK